jgi:cystathionine beta-synthase
VLSAEPPVMAAEVVGSIVEHDLLEALVSGKAAPDDQVAGLMSPPLPSVGSGEPISAAARALAAAGAAVVLVDGKPAGLITRQDVLAYLSGEPGTA